jgi:transposase
MSRYDLTDFEWRVIEPLLPNKPRGVPRVDVRRVLNGIFWVLRSGAPWRDLPERYGPRTYLLQSLRAMAEGRRLEPADGRHQRGP